VFRHRDRNFLIYGAALGDRSTLPLFEAEGGDLGTLAYRGLLFDAAQSELPFAECPNFLPLGDRWLLLMSPFRPVEWRLGSFDGARFSVERQGIFDEHDSFYATNTCEDAEGRSVVFGWIRGFAAGKGWSGCLAFPRLIEPDPRAGIRQRVHPAIEALRSGAPTHWRGRVDGRVVIAPGVGRSVEVHTTLSRPATLQVAGIPLVWDGEGIELGGTRCELQVDRALDLTVFVDRTTVEVFADEGRTVLTRVLYPERRDADVALSGRDVSAEVVVHRLAPCPITPWTITPKTETRPPI
jgi:beta-fructofuranosidase